MSNVGCKSKMRLFNGHQRISEASLRKIFLMQLGNIFSVKTYLVANLPVMANSASFSDLKFAILENVADIKLQILRMDVIYSILGEKYVTQDCPGVRALVCEVFVASKAPGMTGLETDITLLVHLQALESIEVICFNTLLNIASSMPEKNLNQLLLENLDLAKDNNELYDMITREYVN